MTSVFGVWAACEGALWQVWSETLLPARLGCVLRGDAGVAWLR